MRFWGILFAIAILGFGMSGARAREVGCEPAFLNQQKLEQVKLKVFALAHEHGLGVWAEVWERAHILRAHRPKWSGKDLASHLIADAGRPFLDELWHELHAMTLSTRERLLSVWRSDRLATEATTQADFREALTNLIEMFPRPDQPLTFETFVRIQFAYAHLQDPRLFDRPDSGIGEVWRYFPYEFPVFILGRFNEVDQLALKSVRWIFRSQLRLGETMFAHGAQRYGGYVFYHDSQHAQVMRIQDLELYRLPNIESAWIDQVTRDIVRWGRLEMLLNSKYLRFNSDALITLRTFVLFTWMHEWGERDQSFERLWLLLHSTEGSHVLRKLNVWTKVELELRLREQIVQLSDVMKNP